MAMLEAQAAGLPVISHAARGVPDVVCNGRTGLLAQPGDEDALARFARELLTDPGRRIAMGREAARFAGVERGMESTVAALNQALLRLPAANESDRRAAQR